MLSSFYEYDVIEQDFRRRLIIFFAVSSNDRFFMNFLTKILPWALAPMTIKGLMYDCSSYCS